MQPAIDGTTELEQPSGGGARASRALGRGALELDDETADRVSLLALVKPFDLFEERWLTAIVGLMTEMTLEEGERIYRAGDRPDAAYLVLDGEMATHTDTVGEPVRLVSRVRRGELLGDAGVLERSRRTTSARARRATRLLRLDGEDLLRLGRAHPSFGLKLVNQALLKSMREPVRALESAKGREVRVRVGQPVVVLAGDRDPLRTELENLSVGGCCLRGVPMDWHLYESTPISIRLENGAELLAVSGRIAWRRGPSVGIAFTTVPPEHDDRVERALDLMLDPDGPPPAAEPFELQSFEM